MIFIERGDIALSVSNCFLANSDVSHDNLLNISSTSSGAKQLLMVVKSPIRENGGGIPLLSETAKQKIENELNAALRYAKFSNINNYQERKNSEIH